MLDGQAPVHRPVDLICEPDREQLQASQRGDDAVRRDLIERELMRIQGTSGLSPDVSEIVSNALAMGSGGDLA